MPRKKTTHSLTVSVIIPAYNAEKSLSDCLDALLNQSILPNEIIVVDDGSKDSTKTIAESFSLVKVISQKNQGPARARNVGAKEAESDVIIFIDSDCIVEKNWLKEMLIPFQDENVVGVQGAYKTKQTSLVARFDQADIEYRYERMKRQKHLDWIGTYSAAYKRDIFLKENGFDESFPRASGEDPEFSYRLAEKGYVLKFAPTAIVYHTHPSSLIRYLKVKFFRAYWRMRMYVKHPKKIVKDSYTPKNLKFSVALAICLPIFLIGHIFIPFWIFWALFCVVGFFLLFSMAFSPLKIGITLWITGLILYFLRSLVFALGLFLGFIDRRVWK